MKISKERLLQIIREEVELHEKNTLELDEQSLEEISREEGEEILDAAKKDMEGDGEGDSEGEREENLEEETTAEDQIIDPESREVIEPPKNSGKIEIKIR